MPTRSAAADVVWLCWGWRGEPSLVRLRLGLLAGDGLADFVAVCGLDSRRGARDDDVPLRLLLLRPLCSSRWRLRPVLEFLLLLS